jgi:protein TonB
MFDYATTRPTRRFDSSRFATTGISIAAHIVVIVAIAIPALLATDALPTPPTMMAFVVESAPPPPPPPPPPPAAPEVKPPPTAKTRKTTPVERAVTRPTRSVPAPIEAPTGIAPETGLEADTGAAVSVAAGFEGGIPGGVVGGVIGGIHDVAPPPPPPAPVVKAPVRVGGQITPPQLIRRVAPEYPLIAQSAQIEGTVILEATVDEEGDVQSVRVLRSHAVLDEAAKDAVAQWKYEPLVLNGVPQPFVLTVTVSFNLERPQ